MRKGEGKREKVEVRKEKGDFDYEQKTKDLSFFGDHCICLAGSFPAVLGFGRAGLYK
jgi:hypothetical protein